MGWLIGASEAAAVLGWSRFDDRFALWHRKHGLLPEVDDMDERQEAGLALEQGILDWYQRRTKRPVLRPDVVAACMMEQQRSLIEYPLAQWRAGQRVLEHCDATEIEHAREVAELLALTYVVHYGPDAEGRVTLIATEHPHMAVSPDAFAKHEQRGWGFIDAKNIDFDRAWDKGATVPPEYTAQIVHATMPTALQWGGFAVCVAGQRLMAVDIEREAMAEVEQLLGVELPAFVRALDHPMPPPPSGTEASLECLRRRWPKHEPRKAVGWVGEVEACGQQWDPLEWDDQYQRALEQRREWQAEVHSLEVVIRYVAKDAGQVVLPGGVKYSIAMEGNRERIRRRAREG